MPSTKYKRNSDTVDFIPHHFDMNKTSSEDSAAITAPKLIHELEIPTLASPIKVE